MKWAIWNNAQRDLLDVAFLSFLYQAIKVEGVIPRIKTFRIETENIIWESGNSFCPWI